MDAVWAVCRRLLGDDAAAERCATPEGSPDQLTERLSRAVACCRAQRAANRDVTAAPEPGAAESEAEDLRTAVARELRSATAGLSAREREAMALRDVAGLTHAEIAAVLAVEPPAVLALLIRARLGLRSALRGQALTASSCPEHERALRTITLRIDSEAMLGADDDWLVEHVGHCEGCRRAHATLLEAAACYRGWPQ